MGHLEHDELRDQSMPARKPAIDHDNHDLGDLDAARRGSDAQLAPYRDEATPMGGGKKTDVELNVIAVKAEKGGTRITLGGAAGAGIKVGADGYVPVAGMSVSFKVDKIEGPHAFASVEWDVAVGTTVIMNPASHPKEVGKPQKNIKTRITGHEIVGGRTKILIGAGLGEGVRAGMDGHVILANGRHESFRVEKVEASTCHAFLELRPDDLTAKNVVINP